MKKSFDDDVLIVTHNPVLVTAAALPLVLGVAAACSGVPSALGLGLGAAWLSLGGLLYVWARKPCARETPARVRVDGGDLRIDGALRLPKSRLKGGAAQPRACAPPLVRLSVSDGTDVELVLRDIESARRLLCALEVDETHVFAEFWALARPLGEPRSFARAATLVALVLALGILAGQAAPAGLALAVVALAVAFAAIAFPTRVTVGADGVLLRWLGTTRFVPWATVAALESFDGGVVLALMGGRWLTIRVAADHERHDPERDAMFERMRSAWRAHPEARADDAAVDLVRRRGSRTREWVRAMRAIVRPPEGYRTAAAPPEGLWRVVEDSSADRAARTGAALALAPVLDDAGRTRLRAAADACAEPRLRVALTTAATEAGARAPEEELAGILDAIESEVDDVEAR